MLRQFVKDYELIEHIPEGNYRFDGGSCAPKGMIFHIIDDASKKINVLDIGFGLGHLGEVIKKNPSSSHWEIDGIDGYEVACFNTALYKENYYRNIWHGLAQDLSIDQLRKYDVICLLDVIEHLNIETSKWLLRTLLSALREDSFLFISTPLWFYPQAHKKEGDLEEHLIGVPASSMMALQPIMYAFGVNLVAGFIYKRTSLEFIEFFQPTADKTFSEERGKKVAISVGMRLIENVLYKTGF
jgi:2-polyprenyl-3-methyl-5-hydroxy-6-metoxy-1,4-benzoquinol methylase